MNYELLETSLHDEDNEAIVWCSQKVEKKSQNYFLGSFSWREAKNKNRLEKKGLLFCPLSFFIFLVWNLIFKIHNYHRFSNRNKRDRMTILPF